jgi:predicted amidohydrolase
MKRFAHIILIGLMTVPSIAVAAPMTIASVQMEVTDDVETNLARILEGIDAAKNEGARVVLFPETALSGFSQTAFTANWDKLPDAQQQIAQRAAEQDIYVLYGSATESGEEKPYNSAILIDPDGAEVTRYHKMFPESCFTPGDHLALFEIDGVPCTLMICHDERFPELTRIPVAAGAKVCFYISYEINGIVGALRKMDGYRAQLVARAVENSIWVVQSNGIGPLDAPKSLSLGQSRAIDPGGVLVKELPALVDDMLVVTIDPDRARRGNVVETARQPRLQAWYEAGFELLQPAAKPVPSAMEKTTVRIAQMRTVPVKWDLEGNFEVFLKYLAEADEVDAEIFITPEGWLDGYAAPDKASTPERILGVAQDLEKSPYIQRVAQEAKERQMWICFGFTSLENGKAYNAAGLWNDQGELVGVYHKTHIQTHDVQYASGMSLPVFPSPWGPLGIMICADRRWPETARTLRLKGAKLILNPTYGFRGDFNTAMLRTRGFENQCYVAFTHPSESLLVDPRGKVVHRDENDGITIAEIDLTKATDGNHIQDRRPDIYGVITEVK